MIRRMAAGLAVVVLAGTLLVTLGVAQGRPPKALAISSSATTREISAVKSASGTVQDGEGLFDTHGCSDCHTMAAGHYTGRLGPRLDVQSQADSIHAIVQNIEHPPDDDKGYESGLMPENFGRRLSQHDLQAIASYIHAAASAAKG